MVTGFAAVLFVWFAWGNKQLLTPCSVWCCHSMSHHSIASWSLQSHREFYLMFESVGSLYLFDSVVLVKDPRCLLSCSSNSAQGRGCPQLSYLDISWCRNVTNEGVISLAEGCPKINTFFSRGCTQVGAFQTFLTIQDLLACLHLFMNWMYVYVLWKIRIFCVVCVFMFCYLAYNTFFFFTQHMYFCLLTY